jgi:threonine synthase
VKPNTIAKSLAIGNPADGFYALGSIRETNGSSEDVSDEEIVDAIKLLASAEGIFTETAGEVTLGVAKKLVEQGKIPKNEINRNLHHRQWLKTPGSRRRQSRRCGDH